MIRDFARMSPEQATRYAEYVAGLGEVRLSDLAYAMARTGGPMEAMDGTVDSLVPLWTWYCEFASAGYPGVPDGVAATSDESFDLGSKTDVAAELLEGYLFEVMRRIYPETRWSAYRQDPDDATNGRTVVYVSPTRWLPFDSFTRGRSNRMVAGLLRPDHPTWDQAYLRTLVWSLWVEREGRVRVEGQRPGASILKPYLEQPPVATSDPRRRVPELGPTISPAPGELANPLLHEELVIAKPGKELDDPSAAPMDARKVLAVLLTLGFRTRRGAVPTLRMITGDQGSFIVGTDDRIEVFTFGRHRKLRQIGIDAYFEAEKNWVSTRHAFAVLARDLDAIMSPDGEFPNVVIRP